MYREFRSVALAGLAALGAVMMTGCASTSEIAEIRAMAEDAKATADKALQRAEEANTCCNNTNEKIDRMFKKSMYK